jgi:hypothetical protein
MVVVDQVAVKHLHLKEYSIYLDSLQQERDERVTYLIESLSYRYLAQPIRDVGGATEVASAALKIRPYLTAPAHSARQVS